VKKWSISRYSELGLLQTLLHEAASINRGNGCLERIARCIKLARRLDSSSLNRKRPSFMQFLIGVAAGREGNTP
jgi:hypothetical protein